MGHLLICFFFNVNTNVYERIKRLLISSFFMRSFEYTQAVAAATRPFRVSLQVAPPSIPEHLEGSPSLAEGLGLKLNSYVPLKV